MLRKLLMLTLITGSRPLLRAAEPQDLHLEYRRNAAGVYTAFLQNRHAAAVTAYIAEASYREGTRERHSAIGGDTLGFSNGEDAEVPPMKDTDTGRPLPVNAPASAARVLAVIFADGKTEGEDEVVAMLLSGRHRALADLEESLKILAQNNQQQKLLSLFESMQARDQEEGATLDELQDAPGRMRYRYFMSAVPTAGIQALHSGATAATLRARFEDWRKRLSESRPDVR